MEIVAGRCICTVSKKEGNKKFIEESEKFECTVSKNFIEEMYGLLKEGEDGEIEIGKVPKRLRSQEKGFQHQELKKMRHSQYEGLLMEAMQARPIPVKGARFRTGQSVHHFWSSWFVKAEEPKVQLQGSSRPKWYSAGIVAALGERKIKYAGHEFQEQTYQVH